MCVFLQWLISYIDERKLAQIVQLKLEKSSTDSYLRTIILPKIFFTEIHNDSINEMTRSRLTVRQSSRACTKRPRRYERTKLAKTHSPNTWILLSLLLATNIHY